MGFFEGLKSAMSGENNVDFFCREYARFALSQPDDILVTFFQGFRSAYCVSAKKARIRFCEEESMFSRFSGEELSSTTKLGYLARAIYLIEQQPGAIPRPAGHPLNLEYFFWDGKKEAAAIKSSQEELRRAAEKDPFLREQLADMGFTFDNDQTQEPKGVNQN